MKMISADLVAAKLHAARIGNAVSFAEQIAAEPRLAELLWHLQSASLQPGGLDAFVTGLVTHYAAQFQSQAMLNAGAVNSSGSYTLAQCLSIWKTELDCFESSLDALLPGRDFGDYTAPFFPEDINLDQVSYGDFLSIFVRADTTPADAGGRSAHAAALKRREERFNFAFLNAECIAQARRILAAYLSDLCTLPHITLSAQGYCASLPAILIENLDRHAHDNAAQIAETVITRTVRRELEFARTEGVPVPIVGESRFGKTKSISNWCAMYPGRARLVTTPNNNAEMAFIRAHADAFGIEYNAGVKLYALRDKVEFVIRQAGLLVVYDEAHALVPIGYTKATPPNRLNWVRSAVIDQGVACAFFATPQSYQQTLDKYAQTTGYRMEQWLGRMAPPVILSDLIPVEEIVAVARKQFPELTQAQLEELADRAILSDGYLKNLDMAGRRARFLARERGHVKPSTQDVLDACADMMPTEPRVVAEAAPIRKPRASHSKPVAQPLQLSGRRSAAPLSATPAPEFSPRSTSPARVDTDVLLKV